MEQLVDLGLFLGGLGVFFVGIGVLYGVSVGIRSRAVAGRP